MQGARSKVFPCLLRCSLISVYPTPIGKGSRSLGLSIEEQKREQSHLSILNSLLLLWLKTLAMFCILLVCFSWHFVAFEIFIKGLMLFYAVGRGLWWHGVNVLPGLQYQSDLLSYGCNLSWEKTKWYQQLTYLGRSPFIIVLLTAAASFSFWF